MGFRYQRRVTLFPGVRLNFSARGMSVSVGPRGASLNFSPRGTALNLGIPGTGLSFRQNLTSDTQHTGPALPSPGVFPPTAPELPAAEPSGTAIASAPVAEVTSESLESLKQLILKVAEERDELGRALPRAREELADAERLLRRAHHWLLGLFLKKKIPERQAKVDEKAAALKDLEARHDGAFIDTEFTLDETTRAAFDALAEAFEQVAACVRIWDITREEFTDRRVTRSMASRSLERTAVRFSISDDPILQTPSKVLVLENANGVALLLYPGFLLMQDSKDLALIDLREVRLSYHQTKFVETEQVPSDAVVVDHTWAKCNKDGSPDRRFANNYRIPIAGYGLITIKTDAGVNEEYHFSSAERAQRFAELFADYQNKLRVLGNRAPKAPVAPAGATALQPTQLPEATTPTPETPAPKSAPFVLQSLEFIRAAEAMSAEHAVKVVSQFVDMFKADVETFSATGHPMPAWERLANDVTSAPGAVQEFLGRTAGVKAVTPKILGTVRDLVRNVLAQMRSGIEQSAPEIRASPEAAQTLKTIREAEQVMAK